MFYLSDTIMDPLVLKVSLSTCLTRSNVHDVQRANCIGEVKKNTKYEMH